MSNLIAFPMDRVRPCSVPAEPAQDRARPRKARERVGGLEFYPRLGLWKASNVTLDPSTLEAHSYSWWLMARRFGDLVVFNSFRYSVSTSKHQFNVRCWLGHHGISYVTLEAPRGLDDLDSARRRYLRLIDELKAEIAKPRTRKAKNQEREAMIQRHRAKLALIDQLESLQARGLA